jgi:lactoylglutathione lyase
MIEMASLVLFAADLQATGSFYRSVGLQLAEERHDDGPVHLAVELGPVHFAIYAADAPGHAPERRGAGASFAGFYADSLDAATTALQALGAPVLSEHEEMPWGCRIVVRDPDGRAVEVNQRGHCQGTVT